MSKKKKKAAASIKAEKQIKKNGPVDVTAESLYVGSDGTVYEQTKASGFDWLFAAIILPFLVQLPLTLIGVGNYFIYYVPAVLFVIAGLCIWKFIYKRKNRKYYKGKLEEKKSLKKVVLDNVPLVLFGVYAIIMIISTLINCPELVTFTALDVRCDGLIPYLGAIAFMFAALAIDSQKLRLWLVRIFIVVASIFNLAYVIKSAQVGGSNASSIGVFVNSNHVGYYLVLSTMAAAVYYIISKTRWERVTALILEALGVFGLAANNTLGAQLATFMGLLITILIVFLCRGKEGLRTLVPLAVAIVVFASSLVIPIQAGFNSEDGSSSAATNNASELVSDVQAIGSGLSEADGSLGSGRLERWRMGVDYLKEKPILGYGAEVGDHLTYGADEYDRIHNEYFHFALMYGIPAATIYVLAILAVFIRGLRYRKNLTALNMVGLSVAFAYAVSAFVGVVIPFIYPFFFIFLGLGYYRKEVLTSK